MENIFDKNGRILRDMMEPTVYMFKNKTGVCAGLHYIRGNRKPYFSVTGFVGFDTCGACHAELLNVFPEIQPLVALHLADDEGRPMYATENGYYWLTEKSAGPLAECLRISVSQAEEIIGRFTAKPFSLNEFNEAYCLPSVERWKQDARAGFALIEALQKSKYAISKETYREKEVFYNR